MKKRIHLPPRSNRGDAADVAIFAMAAVALIVLFGAPLARDAYLSQVKAQRYEACVRYHTPQECAGEANE